MGAAQELYYEASALEHMHNTCHDKSSFEVRCQPDDIPGKTRQFGGFFCVLF
ncbi:hypothetical protein ACZ87_01552 [Candidatus Erwinia dacicola]|uniref:Uncharacterized protein n=1 Tax=Candidatus Erwinia dacicola TaxID=252393 RepID=A0A328TRB1_9GAMM|nr:hypothetical protein ACZ87_01552 [Candidatus Erwinia dacicola]